MSKCIQNGICSRCHGRRHLALREILAKVYSELPKLSQIYSSSFRIAEVYSQKQSLLKLPEFIQNGQSSMCRGNEAPNAKSDIDQSVVRIAKIYSKLP